MRNIIDNLFLILPAITLFGLLGLLIWAVDEGSDRRADIEKNCVKTDFVAVTDYGYLTPVFDCSKKVNE